MGEELVDPEVTSGTVYLIGVVMNAGCVPALIPYRNSGEGNEKENAWICEFQCSVYSINESLLEILSTFEIKQPLKIGWNTGTDFTAF